MAVIKIKTSALNSGVAATKFLPSNTTVALGALDKGELAFSYANGILVVGTGLTGSAANSTTAVNKIIGGSAFFDDTSLSKTGDGNNVLATQPVIVQPTIARIDGLGNINANSSYPGSVASIVIDATCGSFALSKVKIIGQLEVTGCVSLAGTMNMTEVITFGSVANFNFAEGITFAGTTGSVPVPGAYKVKANPASIATNHVQTILIPLLNASTIDTFATLAAAQELTNKTLTAPVITDAGASSFANTALHSYAYGISFKDSDNNPAPAYIIRPSTDGIGAGDVDAATDLTSIYIPRLSTGSITLGGLSGTASSGTTIGYTPTSSTVWAAGAAISGTGIPVGATTATASSVAGATASLTLAGGVTLTSQWLNASTNITVQPFDVFAVLNSAQTFTNKTLTSPNIGTINAAVAINGATSGGTLTITASSTGTAGVLVLTANTTVGGKLTITELATATGSTALAVAPANHTGVTAETPAFSVATNAIATTGISTQQRFSRFTAGTFTGTGTIVTAATVAISGAPTAAAAQSITNSYALWVESGDVRLVGETILSGAIAGNISADNISSTASVTAGTIFNSASPNDFNKIFTASSGTGSTITFASAPTVPTGAVLAGSFINGAGIAAGTLINSISGTTLILNAAVGTITATNYIISFARTITATAASAAPVTGATTAILTIQALSYIVYAGSTITNVNFPLYSYVSANAAVGATSLAVTFGSPLGAGITTANATFTITHARHFLSAAIAGSGASSIISTASGLVGGSIIYRNSYIFGTGITALTTIIKTTESATAATALRLSNPLTAAITASPYVIINMVPAATISSTGAFTTSGAISVESGNSLFGGAITSTGAISGNSLTASNGVTVTAGGLTVTAGGLTVTAGGLNVTAGAATFNYASGISFKDFDDIPISAYVIRPNEATDADTHVSTILLPRCTNIVTVTVASTTAASGGSNSLTISNNITIFPVGSVITGVGISSTGSVVTTTAGVIGGYTTIGLSAPVAFTISNYTITYAIDTLAVLGSAQTFTGATSFTTSCPSSTITPTLDTHIANKAYVDGVAVGLHVHPPADVILLTIAQDTDIGQATTYTGTITATVVGTVDKTITYGNGSNGYNVGQIGITATSGTLSFTVDGVASANWSRIVIAGEGQRNGIYDKTVISATSITLTRASDANLTAEINGGDFVFIKSGTLFANCGFVQTAIPGATTLDHATTPFTPVFVQFSYAGVVTAGDGLTKTGTKFAVGGTTNRISISDDSIDIDANYVGQGTIHTVGIVQTGTIDGGTFS